MTDHLSEDAAADLRSEIDREIEHNFGRWNVDETPMEDLTDLSSLERNGSLD